METAGAELRKRITEAAMRCFRTKGYDEVSVNDICREAGVVMTPAGATFPYGVDPRDRNIRVAPSLPPVEELRQAMEIFCVSMRLAALAKLLAD